MAVSYPTAVESYGVRHTAREQAAIRRALRILERDMRGASTLIDAPAAARDYLRLWLGHQPVEIFGALFLDVRHQLSAAEELSRGTLTQPSVYPREVVKAALRLNAESLILTHNHPSGNPEPSPADRVLTETLKSALALVDVRVLDHIIVTRGGVTSFSERGLI